MFKDDLKLGKLIENEVCENIRKKYPKAHVIEGYFKGGDIYVPELDMLIEVKYDPMSDDTGNFCIEIKFDGEDSALITTESAWWVLVDKTQYIWITPDCLWMIIHQLKIKPREFVGRGDCKFKTAYLIKKEKIIFSPYVKLVKRFNFQNPLFTP